MNRKELIKNAYRLTGVIISMTDDNMFRIIRQGSISFGLGHEQGRLHGLSNALLGMPGTPED